MTGETTADSGQAAVARFAVFLLILVAAVVNLPFFFSIAGDAQVHLAVADAFARGAPFTYNHDEVRITASTSLLWTAVLTLFLEISPYLTPLLLKLLVAACFAAYAWTSAIIARRFLRLREPYFLAYLAALLFTPAISSNALGGLENIFCGVLLLLLFQALLDAVDQQRPQPWLLPGILGGLLIATRLDAALIGGVLYAVLPVLRWLRSESPPPLRSTLPRMLAAGAVALALGLPLYLYQYVETGHLLSESSVARLAFGRLNGFELIPGILYFHAKPLLTLAFVFAPLFLGACVTLVVRAAPPPDVRMPHGPASDRGGAETLSVALLAAWSVIVIGLVFYSFVVGAQHFGRYFLPIFPFFFAVGVRGLQDLADSKPLRKLGWLRSGGLVAAVAYLFAINAFDYTRRVIGGQHFDWNLLRVMEAPAKRTERTDALISQLPFASDAQITIALTEVQLRYFLDERIQIISVDGRSAGDFRELVRADSEIDFATLLERTKPDLLDLSQTCEIKKLGFLSAFLPPVRRDNLLCDMRIELYERKTGELLWRDAGFTPLPEFGVEGLRFPVVVRWSTSASG